MGKRVLMAQISTGRRCKSKKSKRHTMNHRNNHLANGRIAVLLPIELHVSMPLSVYHMAHNSFLEKLTILFSKLFSFLMLIKLFLNYKNI